MSKVGLLLQTISFLILTRCTVIAREMKQTIRHASAGDVEVVSPPVRFDGKQTAIRIAPPLLGQHTWEVHDVFCKQYIYIYLFWFWFV
jgi:crotonobetainyl-CoA:carnitine CoA-transferase CaiB-like acyl-CoA transferase